MAALGPAVIPALLTATETVPWLAPMAASTAAAAGTAGLGTAAGLGAAAGGGGGGGLFGGGLFGSPAAYGMLPGIPLGSEQAAMLASQTGTFGLPGLAATGNAAASAASGPMGQAFWSGLSKLTGPGSNAFTGALRGANTARTGLQMMQGQPQQQQRPAPMAAPVQSGPPPQVASNVPTPAQLAAWRRVKGRMQRSDIA